TVDDRRPIVNMDILIYIDNVDLGDVYIGDVHTMPTVITTSVIVFSGRQRNPSHILRGPDPADIARTPVNITGCRGYPAPAYACHKGPSAIVIGRPSPRLV